MLLRLIYVAVERIVKRMIATAVFPQQQCGNIFYGDYLLKRELPVICFGFSMPIKARMLGATSARLPSPNLVPVFKPSGSEA